MKKSVLLLLSLVSVPVFADVGVSIQVGQPGFYGQIDLGNMQPPPVVYAQPVVIDRYAPEREMQPIYLRVPPGYERHWDRYCSAYHACGRPVYFVRENWYRQVYAPYYQRHVDEYWGHDDRYDDRGDHNWDEGHRDHEDDRHDGDRHDGDHPD